MEPNLAVSIYVRSSIKFLHFVPFHQQILPPRAILVSHWLLFKKKFPLKLIGKMQPNLAGSIYVRSENIRWFIGLSCSAIVVIIIGNPSAQIFRWTSHFSGNIDKFKNMFVSLNTVVIKYQKLLIYLVSFKYLTHLYHFATMVTGCVAISQRKDKRGGIKVGRICISI